MPLYDLAIRSAQGQSWRIEQRYFLDEDDALQAAIAQYEDLLESEEPDGQEWEVEVRDRSGTALRLGMAPPPHGWTLH
ncbi:hypothetical protein SLNSH_08025 [Alsobacter soli]|uniref:Uncharacterized protein n=1 Tax=Alsobacter soli TaxID=2109933 RepID=A0A2T1HV53_9HYPH|nr:hypothetical protein [Alsobacter soli]PSC05527.1 hypothetical protein SLNSH_08025 [Alsobacter soli]